ARLLGPGQLGLRPLLGDPASGDRVGARPRPRRVELQLGRDDRDPRAGEERDAVPQEGTLALARVRVAEAQAGGVRVVGVGPVLVSPTVRVDRGDSKGHQRLPMRECRRLALAWASTTSSAMTSMASLRTAPSLTTTVTWMGCWPGGVIVSPPWAMTVRGAPFGPGTVPPLANEPPYGGMTGPPFWYQLCELCQAIARAGLP